jgi:hypothetical protein
MDMHIEFELLSFGVLHIIIICSLIPVVIEMDNVVHFTSQRDNDYY